MLFYVKQTHSTNSLMWEKLENENLPEGFVIYTDFQQAGKGQHGNSWESAPNENLLFSLLLYPRHITIDRHFILSQIVSVAIKTELDKYTKDISIKWPNDIYWQEKKIAGILIENAIQNANIVTSVLGIGLNVNQTTFLSDAPNPISLVQITGQTHDAKSLLDAICDNIISLYNDRKNYPSLKECYFQSLYRKEGFHSFETAEGYQFEAKIDTIHQDGQLVLLIKGGYKKSFYFKEVRFL